MCRSVSQRRAGEQDNAVFVLQARRFRAATDSHHGELVWDNAVVESFFQSLKAERVKHCRYRTCEEARVKDKAPSVAWRPGLS